MADVIDRRPGGGGASAEKTLYKDEGDGSFPEAVAGLMRGYNATSAAWERVPINNTSGGMEVHVVGGSTAGTEYTEDAAAAADPVGGAVILVRDDTPGTLVDTDGDNVAQRGTNYGAAFTQIVTSAGAFVDTFGGGTEYTQDAAVTDPATASTFLMARDDAPATQESADNDWTVPRATQYGAQYVQVVNSSGSFVDTFGGGSAPSHTDDAAFTVATDSVSPLGAMLDDTATDTVEEGDVGVVRMTSDRVLLSRIDSTALDLALGSDISDVFGTASVLGGGTEAGAVRVTVANDSTGVLSIDDNAGSLTVDSGAAFTVQEDGAALTALQLIDDVVYTDDTSTHATGTSKGAGIMAAATPTDGAVEANDIGMLAMSLDRRLHVDADLTAQSVGNLDVNIAASAATVTTTPAVTGGGTEAAAQRVTIANDSTGVVSVDDNGANLSVDWGGTVPPIGAGTEAAALRVTVATDSTGVLSVDDNGGELTVNYGSGTFATSNAIVDGWDNAASDGASVSGDVAHDTADAGEPVKIGGKALDFGADPTEVATNDRTDAYFTRAGQMFTLGGHPNIITHNTDITDADGAQTNTNLLSGATGANDRAVVTMIDVVTDDATTAGTQCRIGFGASATPAVDADDVIINHPGIPPGGGIVKGNGGAIVGVGAEGEDLFMTCEDPVGGGLSVTVHYFIIDSA